MKLKTKFQDEDFELGEVVEAEIFVFHGCANKLRVEVCAARGGFHTFYFDSLKELTDMFEDYNEPKEYWYVDTTEGSVVEHTQEMFELTDKERKEIGNYFSSREEAEEAVEKHKAWKRLKEKGLRFVGWDTALRRHEPCDFVIFCDFDGLVESEKDLDLLFCTNKERHWQ